MNLEMFGYAGIENLFVSDVGADMMSLLKILRLKRGSPASDFLFEYKHFV